MITRASSPPFKPADLRRSGDKIDAAISADRLERVEAWGRASSGVSYVYRPTTIDQLSRIVELAQKFRCSVGLRGGGNSYGDAAMNDENVLVDLRRMNRILAWEPSSGKIRVEPGVTLQQLWEYVLEDGWWPPVVTGTMQTTIGGCAAMNVHGKNAYQVGTIGDHILEFDLLLTSGETITCSPNENADVFFAAIGGFGMLGCFTSVTLKMKRIYSGWLEVSTESRRSLSEIFSYFEENVNTSDYIVGWLDAFARGRSLGRGDVHKARYLERGEDPLPGQSLRLENQHLPPTLFGVVPKSLIWMFMRPFMNNLGWRLVNSLKFQSGRVRGEKQFWQSHAAFHFLLDYVPNWKGAYGPGGLIQYQPFIPVENATAVFADILQLCQQRHLPNYLSVLKRHRPDDFLMSNGLDGYSLAMDFRVTERNRPQLAKLAVELDELVLAAGGRFYFAKDSTLRPEAAEAYLGKETIKRFKRLKQRCDPDNLLQTNLWRRIFP